MLHDDRRSFLIVMRHVIVPQIAYCTHGRRGAPRANIYIINRGMHAAESVAQRQGEEEQRTAAMAVAADAAARSNAGSFGREEGGGGNGGVPTAAAAAEDQGGASQLLGRTVSDLEMYGCAVPDHP